MPFRSVGQFHRRFLNLVWHSLIAILAPLAISSITFGSLRQMSRCFSPRRDLRQILFANLSMSPSIRSGLPTALEEMEAIEWRYKPQLFTGRYE